VRNTVLCVQRRLAGDAQGTRYQQSMIFLSRISGTLKYFTSKPSTVKDTATP